jgi:hypothetical protein
MRSIEAPAIYTPAAGEHSIFLAGGITGCHDWQQDMVRLLADSDLVVLNPRRPDFPMDNPAAAEAQIRWEFEHLRLADMIAFWFPCETLCPITLYELGAWAMTSKPLFVGVHPDYQRRLDVEMQLALARPDVRVVSSLADLRASIGAGPAQPG